jgi:hypothetical protein
MNTSALENVLRMLIMLDVSHLPMSALEEVALFKLIIVVTLDVFHDQSLDQMA